MNASMPIAPFKESGVAWLGKIPCDWKVLPLKRLARIQNGRDYKDVAADDGAIPVIGSGGEFARATRPLFSGESVLLGRKGTIDKPLYVNGPFWPVDTMFYTLIDAEADGRFVYYLAKSIPFNYYSSSTALPSMTQEDLSSHVVATPLKEEQARIASSLDRETARIDALIEKKIRFIELLKEKRQALITQAVTKGLDPTVPMKDSGVEWIGEVPAHWEVIPSYRLFSNSKERARATDELLSATQKYGVIPKSQFEGLEGRQVVHVEKNLELRKHVEVDDFVISMRSFQGGLERSRAVGCVRSSYVVLKRTPRVAPEFFELALKSNMYIQGLQSTSDFIRDGQDLTFDNFKLIALPLPPLAEQGSIAETVLRQRDLIDRLAEKTELSVQLLRERRSTLITAAVTGQIDLREDAA